MLMTDCGYVCTKVVFANVPQCGLQSLACSLTQNRSASNCHQVLPLNNDPLAYIGESLPLEWMQAPYCYIYIYDH